MSGVRGATRWPQWREDLLRMLAGKGMSAAQIARELDVTVKAVTTKASKLGISLKGRPPSIWSDPATVALLARLVGEGWSPSEIGKRLGVSRGAVTSRARRDGLTFRARVRRDAACARAGTAAAHGGYRPPQGWTDAALARMRAVAAEGGTSAEAARLLGVPTGALKHAAQKAGIRFDPVGIRMARMWEGKDGRLREMVAAGFGAARIAAELGVNADAVRARCRALEIDLPRDGRAAPAAVTLATAAPVSGLRPGPSLRLVESVPAPADSGPMPVLAAVNGRCRAPLWPDRGHIPIDEKFYCGAPVADEGCAWCADCRARLTTRARVQSVEALAFGKRKRRAG